MTASTRPHAPHASAFRDARAVADLFLTFFRRDLLAFFPQSRFEPLAAPPGDPTLGPRFRLTEHAGADALELFGARYALRPRSGGRFSPQDLRLIRAIGAVLSLRYFHLFEGAHATRIEVFRGGTEDHYIAAFTDPAAYAPDAPARPSRVAATLQTLRTAALSTYENRRVSTGALLLGSDPPPEPTPADALDYGVELTSLKSVHRLCDGRRTLFLVDRAGKLARIIDVERWAAPGPADTRPAADEVPCSRVYTPHARATRSAGNVCVVLSPNQEIKLFAEGAQVFAFAHGRWRILDPATKYAVWAAAVANDRVARALYQTALDLAESRHGGLFVVIHDPAHAQGRLIACHDLLNCDDAPAPAPTPTELLPGDPLAKRALQYLARGRNVADLDPPVLEALAGLDGALAADRHGRLLAFGAILRHDASDLPRHVSIAAEGARTTAALVASRFGPVLKVSEDGVVTCFLDGERAWDL